jgi:hypothetical protein
MDGGKNDGSGEQQSLAAPVNARPYLLRHENTDAHETIAYQYRSVGLE